MNLDFPPGELEVIKRAMRNFRRSVEREIDRGPASSSDMDLEAYEAKKDILRDTITAMLRMGISSESDG